MRERSSGPYLDALYGRLLVEAVPSGPVALLGTRKRNNKIELRAGIDNPADATQNSIHFPKCPKSIDVNRLQARGLREQFLVRHDDYSPHWWKHHLATTPIVVQQICDKRAQVSILHRAVFQIGTCGASV